MVDYSSGANNWKTILFMCYRTQRVNGPYFTHVTLLKFLFINEMPSVMNRVRFGSVILGGNVSENVLHFGQNH